MSASSRWLIGIGVATAVLVAASLLVANLVDREVEYDPASPEGTVQAYLRAVTESDASSAFAFYSSDLQARCEIEQIRDSLQWGPEGFRVSLRDVDEFDDRVEVTVAITQVYGSGPFDRSESTFDQVFVLQQEADGWRFVEAPWPSWCPTPAPRTNSDLSPRPEVQTADTLGAGRARWA